MNKKWQKIVLTLMVFGVVACVNNLPDKPVDLAEFIPKEKIEVVFGFPQNCQWEEISRIIDGDTLWTKSGEKVRFLGINTPEMRLADESENLDGELAKAALEEILKVNEQVCLMLDPAGDTKDKYDRLLAYVFSDDGVDVSKNLLQNGEAEYYRNASYSRKKEFSAIEKKVKTEKIGLWGQEKISWR